MNTNFFSILTLIITLFSVAMSVSKAYKCQSTVLTQYIKYPEELEKRCIVCGGRVKFCYPSGGHAYVDFFGKIKDIRKFYRCTNPECEKKIGLN